MKTVYLVQQDGHWDWFDVSEEFEIEASAVAALDRWREDMPHKQFRLAQRDIPAPCREGV